MKKCTAMLLALLLLFTMAAPVSAAEAEDLTPAAPETALAADENETDPAGEDLPVQQDDATPIVYLRGNGEHLYDAEGNEVYADIGDVKLSGDDSDNRSKIVEAAVNILRPFLLEGMLFNRWDNYGQALYDEISPLFEKAMLDGNGDPQYGSGVSPEALARSERIAATNQMHGDFCGFFTYGFCYDWRLDPYDHVDRLHDYILTVLRATGKQRVSLASRCLGGSLMTAYLEKYGDEGLVKNAMYCETLGNGCTNISKGFSGKIDIDSDSLQRYYGQLTYCDEIGYGIGFSVPVLADEIVQRLLDYMAQNGGLDRFSQRTERLYARLYKALIPALFRAVGFASQPIYWTFVEEEDFDQALELMFGEEGSDLRTENAGLIRKIEHYRSAVTSRRTELLHTFSETYGIHMGVIAKYGMLNFPLVEGYDKFSDSLVSFDESSFGATCATVGGKLPDDYLAARVAAGYGDYLSADGQVDLSTAMFPDTTWVVKNIHHDDFENACRALAETFLNGTGVTVDTAGYARFRVNDYAAGTITEMTADNCGDLEYISRAPTERSLQNRWAAFKALLSAVFRLLSALLRGESL